MHMRCKTMDYAFEDRICDVMVRSQFGGGGKNQQLFPLGFFGEVSTWLGSMHHVESMLVMNPRIDYAIMHGKSKFVEKGSLEMQMGHNHMDGAFENRLCDGMLKCQFGASGQNWTIVFSWGF